MKLKSWEIWHTYSTYFSTPIIDLYCIAEKFLKFGFSEIVMHKDGYTIARVKKGYKEGLTTIHDLGGWRQANLQFKTFDNSKPNFNGYVLENWKIASEFQYSEFRLFGEKNLMPNYIRGLLGLIVLSKKDFGNVHVYPLITLYESGILLVHFRIISPEEAIPLKNFIENYVNILQIKFDEIEAPSSICSLAKTVKHYQNKDFPVSKSNFEKIHQKHDIEVKNISKKVLTTDFQFTLAKLNLFTNENISMKNLALTIFSLVEFLINAQSRKRISISSRKKPLAKLSGDWIGRPHIHIVSHENQAETSTENEKLNKESFGFILARTFYQDEGSGSQFLPKDLRRFEDYSAYISNTTTLWIWSKLGLKRQSEWTDFNRDNLVYEQQVKVELLEYGYMLYRSLNDKLRSISRLREVFSFRKYLQNLKTGMSVMGVYGEIRELFNKGWSAMGVDDLKDQILENLSIVEAEKCFKEVRQTEKVGLALTILFGLIAIPTFAYEVIKPIWLTLNLWSPCQDNLNIYNLFFVGLSTIIIFFVLFLVFRITRSKIKS